MKLIFASLAQVAGAGADFFAKAEPVARALQGLRATLLELDEQRPQEAPRRRGPVSPRPTVEFSDLDEAKAERSLRKHGVLREK